jgi:hypothetical protein
MTFFIGSVLFTLGGSSQCLLAAPERPDRPTGLASWRAAWIQSVGTLLFNLMTFAAITVAATDHPYDTVVWGPNALGSACFLVSGTIFYLSSPRRGLLPRFDHEGWWEASVNLLGCVLFGISAVASYATGQVGALISAEVSNHARCRLFPGLRADRLSARVYAEGTTAAPAAQLPARGGQGGRARGPGGPRLCGGRSRNRDRGAQGRRVMAAPSST